MSPAVVVPSMLLLQEGGYGVEKGVPTLLMAAGSFDDILAITGFNTCLGVAFSTGNLTCPGHAGPLFYTGGVKVFKLGHDCLRQCLRGRCWVLPQNHHEMEGACLPLFGVVDEYERGGHRVMGLLEESFLAGEV